MVGASGLAALVGKAQITAEDVLAARAAIFPDGVVSADEVVLLFDINDAAKLTCPEWRAMFVEAVTDHVVRQQKPYGYVDEAKADWLIARITRDGRVKTDTELELLIRILEVATQAPAQLAKAALYQVAASALTEERRAGGGATLTADEVARLRRVLYAQASDGGGAAISRPEAAVLFTLNTAARGRPNDPSWRDLFVHGVGAALMAAQGYVSPDRETALRRQTWLETPERGPVGALSRGLKEAVLHPRQAILDCLDLSDIRAEALAAELTANAMAAPIDEDEARWLAAQIGRDGVLDDNEIALLLFVGKTADSVHPSLEPLIAQARAKAPAAAAKPVVGHRGVA